MKNKRALSKLLVAVIVGALGLSLFALSACGDNKVEVPNVVSLNQSDAMKVLKSSGFELGEVTYENSETLDVGCVISQEPAAASKAEKGSPVALVLSSGKKALKDVTVPDLTGKTQGDAEKALKDVGLVPAAGNPEETEAVAPGLVFKQSVAAGSIVKEKTKVTFTVALAIHDVQVPDVANMTHDEARDTLQKAGLGFDYTEAYNDNVQAGRVFAQSVAPGTNIKAGTVVAVTISLGAKPVDNVKVPDVMTYTWTDAQNALKSAGLDARYTGDPSGTVVSQDIAAGTAVAPGTLVTVTLATPVQSVDIPNLIGLSAEEAFEALNAAGLKIDATGGEHGDVIDQWPAPGTDVEKGSTVHVTIDEGDFE